MKINSIITVVSFFLVSCTGSPVREKPVETPKLSIPQDLIQNCDKIDKLTSSEMGELYQHDINLMIKYKECSDRHRRLKEAVTDK